MQIQKLLLCASLVLLVTVGIERGFAQKTKKDAAIVYSGKTGITIAAPSGWVIDEATGKKVGVPTVLYPAGKSWDSADTVMYVNFTRRKDSGVKGVAIAISEDLKQTKKVSAHSNAVQAGVGKTRSGIDYKMYDFSGVGKDAAQERIAYLDTPNNVTLLVLSAKTKASFQSALPAYTKWVNDATYLAVTVNSQPAKHKQ